MTLWNKLFGRRATPPPGRAKEPITHPPAHPNPPPPPSTPSGSPLGTLVADGVAANMSPVGRAGREEAAPTREAPTKASTAPLKPQRRGKYSNPKIDESLDWAFGNGEGRFVLSRMTAKDLKQIFDEEDVSSIKELHIDGTYFSDAGNRAGNRFGEAGAVTLADCLAKCPGLEELHLEDNEIGNKGLHALAAGLASVRSLKKLRLDRNGISDCGAEALARSLGSLTSLTALNLAHNEIGDAGAGAFAQGLETITLLKTLDLSYNPLGDRGAQTLAASLRKLNCLEKLDLMHCQIGDEGALALAEALRERPALHTNLDYNEIGDEGLGALRRCGSIVDIDRGNRAGWDEAKKRFENQKGRLLAALERADFQTASKIFAIPGSPTVTDALFMACNSRKVEVRTLEWLLENGAQVNSRGPIERTPLHELIMRTANEPSPDLPNPYDKMKLLIAKGTDLTAEEEHGLTPLGLAQYLGNHEISALLSGTFPQSAWEQLHPIEASFETMSRDLVRDHGPLIRVEYVSHWPKFEIKFYYRDGACIYSGARTGRYDIHFLSLGYVGEGPRYAKHYLGAAGFKLTADEIAGIKPGESIVLVDGKAAVIHKP